MILRSLAITTALFFTTSAIAQQSEREPAGIDPDRLEETVRTMASDQFEGRAPGTVG